MEISKNGVSVRVLDKGFVRLADWMGGDLTVVNSARVSFGKMSSELSDSDKKLIRYLANHKHMSPFRHVQFQFHCKVPEFVARQWYKHVVGIGYSEAPTGHFVDHAWNEISGRYVDASDFDYYIPETFRRQSLDNKQASEGELDASSNYDAIINHTALLDQAKRTYAEQIRLGVAKEQARMVLPLCFYTEFYWTASLEAVFNFIKLRQHKGAQGEIQEYAEAVKNLALHVAPVALESLLEVENA